MPRTFTGRGYGPLRTFLPANPAGAAARKKGRASTPSRRRRGGSGTTPAKFGNVVDDVTLFDGNQRGVHHRVQRKVLLPAAQPGRSVIQPAQRREPEGRGMDAQLQFFAVAALQDFQVHGHMA